MFSFSAMGDAPLSRVAGVVAAIALIAFAAGTAFASSPASWTGLAGGKVGEYLWSVKAKRQGGEAGAGPQGAQRPCLLVGTTWEISRFSYRRSKYRNCVDPSGRIANSEPPLIATGVQPTNGQSVKMTAVGMIFPASARHARVTLSDGEVTTIDLNPLAPADAHAAGLGRLRYAAFAVHGQWCPQRIVSRDGSGRILWDSGPEGFTCGTPVPAIRTMAP